MKCLLILILLGAQAFAHERGTTTKADLLATAKFSGQKNHSWPFPLLSIGHNMQSFQDYGGAPYWHDGLDIRSRVDQPIFATVGGKVVNFENYQPGNPLYWEIAILDEEGFVWKYHHVDRKSIPQEIYLAWKQGGSIKAGTLLGNVVRWPISSFGEVYHHLHLLVVGKDGQYINPFLMLEPLPDTISPVIKKIGLAKNHSPINGNEVKGAHALFLEASDLVLHHKFILTPHKISYKLDGADEVIVWEFVNLPSGKNDSDFIEDFYMKGTCGDYSCRKFYINLNFTKSAPRKTMVLSPGAHLIEVFVEDAVGNKSSESFQWKVI
jgi:hypothetical protein